MDKSIKAKRDALIEDEAQWCQCKGSICHNCEPIIRHNFAIGFDAGYALAMEEAKVLVEALEFYSDEQMWRTIKNCEEESKIRIDASDFDAEMFETRLIFRGGKKARQALKEFKEKTGVE